MDKAEVPVWDLRKQRQIKTLARASGRSYRGLAFSDDGKYLVASDLKILSREPVQVWHMRMWDTQNWRVLKEDYLSPGNPETPVQVPRDFSFIARAGGFQIMLISPTSGTVLKTLYYPDNRGRQDLPLFNVSNIAVRKDGAQIAAAVRIQQLDLSVTASFKPHKVDTVEIHIWDTKTAEIVRRIPTGSSSNRRLAFSPDGRYIASVPDYGRIEMDSRAATNAERIRSRRRNLDPIRIWDASNGKNVYNLAPPRVPDPEFGEAIPSVRDVLFLPSSRYFVSAHDDNFVRLWDIEQQRILESVPLQYPFAAHASSDGKRLAVSADKVISIWDIRYQ